MKGLIKYKLRSRFLNESMDAEHLGSVAIMVSVNNVILDDKNLEWAIDNIKENRKSKSGYDVVQICRTTENNNKYYLLDGYHRFVENIIRGNTKIKAMLLNKTYEELKKLDAIAVACAGGRGDKFCNNFKTIGNLDMITNAFTIKEEVIDGQEMNSGTQSLCNTMSVRSYEEVIGRLIAAIGTEDENPEMWKKIAKPINMLKKANYEINKEKRTDGMTGDSMVDEANTWWSAIQTTICEQGPEFQ
jgi:hypothetical protein